MGYIQINAYTSYSRIPLKDVAVTITAEDGTAIAMRLTDRSGKIGPIPIPVPDKEESQSPGSDEQPYTNINIYARLNGYELIESENTQVFADIVTEQQLEMIPLAEFHDQWDMGEFYDTPPQNL